MKRLLIAFIILICILSSMGCDSDADSLSKGQKIAVKNCIKFIKNSSFTYKKSINTKIIKIENITEDTRSAVRNNGSKVEENTIDLTDWVITIGSTTEGHNFAFIVCDSSTYEVIGYIPID